MHRFFFNKGLAAVCAVAMISLGLVSLAAPAAAQQHARAQLETFTQDLQSLDASFVQRVRDGRGGLAEETRGRVYLQQPDRFRWSYFGEFPQEIVADGERVWIHDVELEQVTVQPQAEAARNSPLMVLSDPGRLDAVYDVADLGVVEGVALLELMPRGERSEFQRVLLGFSQGRLASMILEDAFGNRTEVQFERLKRNEELASELFRFEPPEGVDVIGDTGDGQEF